MPGPIDILEEHTLTLGTPPRDAVTVRGLYRRADGAHIVLPAAVQSARDAPEVFVPGVTAALTARREGAVWTADLPAGAGETVRVVARTEVPLEGTRLFTARWPTGGAPVPRVPIRRVALVPRTALTRVPADWTCTDDGTAEIPCVSSVGAPEPLGLTVRAVPSRRFALPIALVFIVLAVALLVRIGERTRRRERLVGALAGSVAGSGVALALVGAAWTTWAVALGIAMPFGAAVGALATRRSASTTLAGIGLLVLPLLSVLDGRPMRVVIATLAMAAVIAFAALMPAKRAVVT